MINNSVDQAKSDLALSQYVFSFSNCGFSTLFWWISYISLISLSYASYKFAYPGLSNDEVFLQRRSRLYDSCTVRECNVKSSPLSEIGLAIDLIKAKSDFVWVLIACQPLSWPFWERHGKSLQDDT
jgi:hypothetical protein